MSNDISREEWRVLKEKLNGLEKTNERIEGKLGELISELSKTEKDVVEWTDVKHIGWAVGLVLSGGGFVALVQWIASLFN